MTSLMDRRTFLGTFGLLVAPVTAEAQPTAKVYQVGILWLGRGPSTPPEFDVFRQSLADSGYIEGRTLLFSHRWAKGRMNPFPDLATELVRSKVDVLFASSSPAIRAAREATTTVPIVVLTVEDPDDSGLVTSLARPGRNITGVSGRVQDLNAKLVELLKESVPNAKRMAVLGGTSVALHRKEMEAAGRFLGVGLTFVQLRSPTELEAAFETVVKTRPQGLILLPTVLFAANPRLIAGLALERRLPAIFWASHFPEAGGLMAYGPDLPAMWRRAGALVGRILKGARPADLPVERADRFRLVINLKTAKALGLTIPPSLLQRADQVIE